MQSTELEATLREIFTEGPYSTTEVQARLAPLRLKVAVEDLLEDLFVWEPRGWSLRTEAMTGLARERQASLSDRHKELLKDWLREKMREARHALDVSTFLDTLATEEREQLPFDWLEDASAASHAFQLSRLLRYDARFVRYEGHCFGLAEWDDGVHLRYWWQVMEAAYHQRDVARFEKYAERVEALSLPEGQRARLDCVLAAYRGHLAQWTTKSLAELLPSATFG